MKNTTLSGILALAFATASQATLVFNEEFDGTGQGYNAISATALVGDNDWVDFANRLSTTLIGAGGEGFAIANGGTESVLAGSSNSNDPQIRSDFEAGFDKTMVTDFELRLRVDIDKNGTYDDPLSAANFNVFWGTDPYVNPGANNGNTQLNFNLGAPTSLVSEMNNGWHVANWSIVGGLTAGNSGDTVRSLRVDPINNNQLASFELDYLRVTAVPEPGTAVLLGLGGALVLAIRRRRKA